MATPTVTALVSPGAKLREVVAEVNVTPWRLPSFRLYLAGELPMFVTLIVFCTDHLSMSIGSRRLTDGGSKSSEVVAARKTLIRPDPCVIGASLAAAAPAMSAALIWAGVQAR